MKTSIVISAINKVTGPVRQIIGSTNHLSTSLTGTQTQLSKLNRQAQLIDSFKKLKIQTDHSKKAWDEAQQKVKSLAAEISNAKEPSKKLNHEFKSSIETAKRLKTNYHNQEQQLNSLRSSLSRSGISTRDLGSAQARLRQETSRLNSELETHRRKLDRAAESQKRMDTARGKMQKGMATAANLSLVANSINRVGAATRRGILSTLAPLRELERAKGELATVGVIDLEPVVAAGKKMSRLYSGITAASFVSAAYDIKSGISSLTDQGVADMTRAASVTARATKAGVDQMTSLFATGYGVFKQLYKGTSDSRFGEIFSAGLAKSVQQFKTTGSGMQQAIESAGSEAALVGMRLADQFTVLGMLQQKMQAGESGTALKSFTKNAARAHEKFSELGFDISTLDEKGQLRAIPDILADIQRAFGNTYTSEIGSQIFEAFGSDEAVKVIQGLWGQQAAFIANRDAIEQATRQGFAFTEKMAKLRDTNLDARLSIITQRFGLLQEKIAGKLAPHLDRLLPKITGVMDRFEAWIDRNPRLSAGLGGVVIAVSGLATAGGALFSVLAGLLGGLTLIKFAATALGIKLPLLSGGLGLVKKGASLAGRGVAGIIRYLSLLDIASAASTAKTVALATAQKAWAIGTTIVTGALRAVTIGFRVMSAAVMSNPIGLVIGGIALAAGLIIAYWEPISAFFGRLWGGVREYFQTAWNTIKTIISFHPLSLVINNWSSISRFFKGLWDGISIIFEKGLEWIKNTVLSPILTIKKTLGKAWDWLAKDREQSVTQKVKQVMIPIKASARAAVLGGAIAMSPVMPPPAMAAPAVMPAITGSAVYKPVVETPKPPVIEGTASITPVLGKLPDIPSLNVDALISDRINLPAVPDIQGRINYNVPKKPLPVLPVVETPKPPVIEGTASITPVLGKLPDIPSLNVDALISGRINLPAVPDIQGRIDYNVPKNPLPVLPDKAVRIITAPEQKPLESGHKEAVRAHRNAFFPQPDKAITVNAPITIHAAPGMDAKNVADLVEAAVERAVRKAENKAEFERRGRLYD